MEEGEEDGPDHPSRDRRLTGLLGDADDEPAELESAEPYRLIVASELPDENARREELGEAESTLRSLIFGLADALPEGGELLKQVVSAQTSAAELVNVVAAALVADTGARQRLLETTDILARIEAVSNEVAAVTARVAPDRRTN